MSKLKGNYQVFLNGEAICNKDNLITNEGYYGHIFKGFAINTGGSRKYILIGAGNTPATVFDTNMESVLITKNYLGTSYDVSVEGNILHTQVVYTAEFDTGEVVGTIWELGFSSQYEGGFISRVVFDEGIELTSTDKLTVVFTYDAYWDTSPFHITTFTQDGVDYDVYCSFLNYEFLYVKGHPAAGLFYSGSTYVGDTYQTIASDRTLDSRYFIGNTETAKDLVRASASPSTQSANLPWKRTREIALEAGIGLSQVAFIAGNYYGGGNSIAQMYEIHPPLPVTSNTLLRLQYTFEGIVNES